MDLQRTSCEVFGPLLWTTYCHLWSMCSVAWGCSESICRVLRTRWFKWILVLDHTTLESKISISSGFNQVVESEISILRVFFQFVESQISSGQCSCLELQYICHPQSHLIYIVVSNKKQLNRIIEKITNIWIYRRNNEVPLWFSGINRLIFSVDSNNLHHSFPCSLGNTLSRFTPDSDDQSMHYWVFIVDM